MSLVAWFPLNGTLKNRGLYNDDLQIEGTVNLDTNGKVGGKAPTFTGDASNGLYVPNFIQITENWQKDFTWAFWFKIEKLTSNYQFLISSGRDYGDTAYSISVSNQGILTLYKKGSQHYSTGVSVSVGEWHHVIMTVDEENIVIYLDKEKVHTVSNTGSIYSQCKNNALYIGKMSYSNNYFPLYGSIQDVRIYNHVLSKTEIRELSKGLVLHYPLSNGYGGENLVLNSANNYHYSGNTVGSGFVYEDSGEYYLGLKVMKWHGGTNGGPWYSLSSNFKCENLVIGNTYTISAYFKADKAGQLTSNLAEGQSIIVSQLKFSNEWTRVWVVFKANATSYNACFYTSYGNESAEIMKYMCGIKIEKGDNRNPIWSPNSADALYSDLEYNSLTEHDSSGYENDGKKTSIINSQSDSPVGSGSYCSPMCIQEIPPVLSSETKEFSISFWVKFDNISYTDTMCIYNNRTAVGSGIAIFLFTGKMRFDTGSGSSDEWNTNFSPKKDVWYYMCFTRTNNTKKLYVNGKLVESTTNTGDLADIATKYASIGKSSCDGSASNNEFKGSLTDFRIYTTELSQDDILKQYESKAKIDKDGNIYCNSFIEENNITKSDNKQRTFSSSLIDGFRRLEYLSKSDESQIGCYIDLNLYPKDIGSIEADVSLDNSAKNGGSYFFGGYYGEQTDTSKSSFYCYLLVSSNSNLIGIGYREWIFSTMTWNLGERHYVKSKLINGEQKLEVDGKAIISNNIKLDEPNGNATTPLMIYQYCERQTKRIWMEWKDLFNESL